MKVKIGLIRTSLMSGVVAGTMIGNLAAASDYTPPKVYTMTPTGVNLSDGSFVLTDIDLQIGPLKLERFHLGGERDPNDTHFGPRFSHNFDIYVAPNQRTDCSTLPACTTYKKPVVHIGMSASGTFYETLPPNVVVLVATADTYAGTLEYNAGGAYVYTDRDGTVYTFSTTVGVSGVANGRRVANIVFADGRRQDFAYNSSGLLKAVIDSSGYAIAFDYNANADISSACAFNTATTYVSVSTTCASAALKTSYLYATDSFHRLTSVTDVLGAATTYAYANGGLSCIMPPGYSYCQVTNTYGSTSYGWQVTKQVVRDGVMPDGATWQFSYYGDYLSVRNPDEFLEEDQGTTATVTDPANKVSSYGFMRTSPTGARDANNRSTSYTFQGGFDYWTNPDLPKNHGSMMVAATFPEGNQYLAEYGGPRNSISKETWKAKTGSGLVDIVKNYGYVAGCTTSPNTPQNCAKPISVKDPKGNQTDFAYTSYGAIRSEMLPAPTATAARPLKLYSYVQKYAYVKNSGGTLVATSTPIWLPDTMTECQTATGSSPAAACDTAAPQRVTAYEYGANGVANNLLVRGVVVTATVGGTPTTLRTCYGYDARGRKISTTTPRGVTGACP